jgi:hypothetical protein
VLVLPYAWSQLAVGGAGGREGGTGGGSGIGKQLRTSYCEQ